MLLQTFFKDTILHVHSRYIFESPFPKTHQHYPPEARKLMGMLCWTFYCWFTLFSICLQHGPTWSALGIPTVWHNIEAVEGVQMYW